MESEADRMYEVAWGSPLQLESVALRRRVLREPLGLEYSPQDLASERGDIHLVALESGRVVAVLLLRPLSDGEIKMRQVAVDPALQRSGLGTRLVAYAEQLAARSGFQSMVLHAREPAVPFYLRLGYHVEGEPFTEVGIPHRFMRKAL